MAFSFLKKYLPLIFFICSVLFLSRALFLNYYPDFDEYYHSPQALMSGNNPYLGGEGFFTPSVYPPFVFVFFYPFSLVPYVVSEKLWVLLSIIFLITSFYLIFKTYKESLFTSKNLLLTAFVFLTFFPTKFTLGMGQINIFIFLLLVLSVYLYSKNKERYAGILLGISILVKFFPIPLIFYFLALHKWRLLFFLFLTLFLGAVAALLLTGSDVNFYFYGKILPSLIAGWKGDYYNQALSGVLARGIENIEIRNLIKIILTLGLIFLSLLPLLRKSKDIYFENLKIGILITTSLMVNTFSWQHHFVWLLFPLFATFFYIKKRKLGSSFYILLFASYVLVAWNFKNPSQVPIILQSHVFYGALIIWGMGVYLIFKKRVFT